MHLMGTLLWLINWYFPIRFHGEDRWKKLCFDVCLGFVISSSWAPLGGSLGQLYHTLFSKSSPSQVLVRKCSLSFILFLYYFYCLLDFISALLILMLNGFCDLLDHVSMIYFLLLFQFLFYDFLANPSLLGSSCLHIVRWPAFNVASV